MIREIKEGNVRPNISVMSPCLGIIPSKHRDIMPPCFLNLTWMILSGCESLIPAVVMIGK
jgi:hypothetical protein